MSALWRRAAAPSMDDFAALAEEAFERLPGQFRRMVGDVSFHVLDFADEATLADLGIEDPFELTGLYTGVPVGRQSVLDGVPQANRVFLYRQPILAEWCESEGLPLGELISHVLVHEIGHHFGLSDAQIHAIEADISDSPAA
jgi:predicted Zn-dependent protease with MMP-like domain